jgi:hypothetical protein
MAIFYQLKSPTATGHDSPNPFGTGDATTLKS